MESGTRLNKYISSHGLCSLREADRAIEAGAARINGRVAVLGDMVRDGDEVEVYGQKLVASSKPRSVYLLLNKPEGVTSTTDQSIRGNVVDYVRYPERIFTVGRLDKDSRGTTAADERWGFRQQNFKSRQRARQRVLGSGAPSDH